jgi:hypothetical protein
MTYTPTTADSFRKKKGTLSDKLYTEFSSVKTETDLLQTNIEAGQIKEVVISPAGTPTALATSGVDLATGADATYYGSFVAPVALTLVGMYDYLTEAYVKDTDDAKIEIYDDSETPALIAGRTLTAEGEDAGTLTSTDIEDGESSIAAGTRLDLKITATASSSGTGHAIVGLRYYNA